MKMRASWIRIAAYLTVTIFIPATTLIVATRNHRNRINHSGTQSLLMRGAESDANVSRTNPNWTEAYGKLPLSFRENLGQTDPEVRFISSGGGYQLFLTSKEAVLAMRHSGHALLSPRNRAADLKSRIKARAAAKADQQTAVLRMRLQDANPQTEIAGFDKLPGRTDYFIGNDSRAWRTNVPSYRGVKYRDIYPGVDLVFHGNRRRLEYDFVVAPGANPKAIAFNLNGADSLQINSRGDLVVKVPGGQVELLKPVVYQEVGAERRSVEAKYAVAGHRGVSFSIGNYDTNQPLIIDPVLNYSTYLGGSGDDAGNGIAVDALGDAFVAGETVSTDFKTTAGGFQTEPQASNTNGAVFVTELNPTGTAEIYSSYLIATDAAGETAFGIALDPSGNVYVTGQTFSTGFPTTPNSLAPGPLASNTNGTAFLTKLNPAANGPNSLVYSTYLGGTGGDFGNGVAADSTGNAYVAGFTASSDFPQPTVPNGFQTALTGTAGNAFLTKINTTANGNAGLVYSTYLGGDGANAANFFGFGDEAFGVAIDANANAYLVGTTTSSNFPTAGNALQPTVNGSNTNGEAFVSRIDTTLSGGPSLIYSTYLGGSNVDDGSAVALGPQNVVYATGTTASDDFPTTPGAFSSASTPQGLAFITLIDTNAVATSLTYSTLVGGSNGDLSLGIQADTVGNAYVTGGVGSTDFPVTKGAFETQLPPGTSGVAYIVKLNPGGNGNADLLYSTFFGGSGGGGNPDVGNAIAIDPVDNAYITGQTFSVDFPISSNPAPFQGAIDGTSDAFVASLPLVATVAVSPGVLNFGTQLVNATTAPLTATLTNNTTSSLSITSVTIASATTDFVIASNTCVGSVPASGSCTVGVTFTPAAVGPATGTLVFSDADPSSPQSISLIGSGTSTAPVVGLSATTLTFASQVIGTTSAAQIVTVTNTGNANLIGVTVSISGDFAETDNCDGVTVAPTGTCTINVTFTPTSTSNPRTGTLSIGDNANGSPQKVSLTGNGADFTMTTSPASLTLKRTASGNFTITVTPIGGFNQAVALTCTGAPAEATCVVAQSPVTPADGVTAVSTTATVTTGVKGAAAVAMSPSSIGTPPVSMRQTVLLLFAVILAFALPLARRRGTRLGLAGVILACVLMPGCGSKGGSPKGTSTLTVTATSGPLTHTATVTLTVD
jgi:hypothetical protein